MLYRVGVNNVEILTLQSVHCHFIEIVKCQWIFRGGIKYDVCELKGIMYMFGMGLNIDVVMPCGLAWVVGLYHNTCDRVVQLTLANCDHSFELN